jgi:hypothetical protein
MSVEIVPFSRDFNGGQNVKEGFVAAELRAPT